MSRTTKTLRRRLGVVGVVGSLALSLLTAVAPVASAGTGFVWPATGRISQNAAQHKASFENQFAQDIANASGTAVVAAAAGVVEASFLQGSGTTCTVDGVTYPGGYGNVVVLRHDGPTTYWSMYGHLSSRDVSKGQPVAQGSRLGAMGSTGCSTGSHLHFQIGNCINAAGLITAACSQWRGTDPASGNTFASWTPVSQGQPIDGDYPGFGGGVGEGSFVARQGSPEIYRIAGGAPTYISSWDPFGGPQPVTGLSPAQFDALPQIPADNTFVTGAQRGEVYRIAGGAPLYVSTWEAFGGPQPTVAIDVTAIDNAGTGGIWNHLRQQPADGTFVTGAQRGEVYRFAGGAPLYVSTWAAFGGPKPTVSVDQAALDNAGAGGKWNHARRYPEPGTTVNGTARGEIYKIVGDAPFYLNSCEAGCGSPVEIDQAAIDNAGAAAPWQHLRHKPADGTVLRAVDTGAIYKVAGGAALQLSNCDPGCDGLQSINQYGIDQLALGHLSAKPANGTRLLGFPSGASWDVIGGCVTAASADGGVAVSDEAIQRLGTCNTSPPPPPTPPPPPIEPVERDVASAPARAEGVTRFAGPDRFATAAQTSRGSFPGTANDVFIVTGLNWPDALAAGAAAAKVNGPVLPVETASIPGAVSEELNRLEPFRAWVVGGTSVLSDAVIENLRARGIVVQRVSGQDRYSTAAAVASRFFVDPAGAFYASGATFADALGGGAAAAKRGWPLLLTAPDSVPAATPVVGSQRIALGGTAAISDAVVAQLQARRVAGTDRYATATAIALDTFPSATVAYLATGLNFPDALVGTPAAARDGAPLLLATKDCVTTPTRDAIASLGVRSRIVLGSTAIVSDQAANLTNC